MIVAKCAWPSVPYFAGSLGMQCLLLPEVRCALCVLCAPCAPASPGEASDAAPKAADPGEMGPEPALGLQQVPAAAAAQGDAGFILQVLNCSCRAWGHMGARWPNSCAEGGVGVQASRTVWCRGSGKE